MIPAITSGRPLRSNRERILSYPVDNQLITILVRLFETEPCHHGSGEQVGPSKRIVVLDLKA